MATSNISDNTSPSSNADGEDSDPLPYSPNPVTGHTENTAASRARHRASFLAGLPSTTAPPAPGMRHRSIVTPKLNG